MHVLVDLDGLIQAATGMQRCNDVDVQPPAPQNEELPPNWRPTRSSHSHALRGHRKCQSRSTASTPSANELSRSHLQLEVARSCTKMSSSYTPVGCAAFKWHLHRGSKALLRV